MAAETKTKSGPESMSALIKAIEDDQQRRDAKTLVELMTRVTVAKPKLWGSCIVGFGTRPARKETARSVSRRGRPSFRPT